MKRYIKPVTANMAQNALNALAEVSKYPNRSFEHDVVLDQGFQDRIFTIKMLSDFLSGLKHQYQHTSAKSYLRILATLRYEGEYQNKDLINILAPEGFEEQVHELSEDCSDDTQS